MPKSATAAVQCPSIKWHTDTVLVFGIRETHTHTHISGEKMGENVSQRLTNVMLIFMASSCRTNTLFTNLFSPFFENLLISRMHKHASR